jgi:hypothetical protein
MIDPLTKSGMSNIFVKMMQYTPERPTLAKSLLDGILCVRKSMSRDQGSWKMDQNAGERLLAVFDELNVDIEKWREMEMVPEESESAVAVLAQESCDDRQSSVHSVAAEVQSPASEVRTCQPLRLHNMETDFRACEGSPLAGGESAAAGE